MEFGVFVATIALALGVDALLRSARRLRDRRSSDRFCRRFAEAATLVARESGGTVVLRTQTDGSGYFVALLPAGDYRVSSGAFAAEATVENGTTTLVPLRTGKRMVD